MTANAFTSEQEQHVRELDEMLRLLQGELDASVNPHRLGMRHLGVNAMGATRSPYNDGAFGVWLQHQAHNPDDLETLHHLAIMHHARAFDREETSPKEAESDWQTALKHWRQLLDSDEFWQRIVQLSHATAKPDPVHELRRELPELLLQIHFDLGFEYAQKQKVSRSNYHIKLALESAFPAEAKANVRRRTYELFTKDIPAEVWQPNVLDPALIKIGTDRIEAYLQVDPGCIPALVDAAKLQVRLLRAWYNEFQAEGDQANGDSPTIRKLKQAADYWSKYLDQLIPCAQDLDDDVRCKVASWYRTMGDVHHRLRKLEDATRFYQSGIRITLDKDEERPRCERCYCETRALLAREKAAQKASGARSYCDQVAVLPGISALARVFLAQAYVALEQFEIAEKLCKDGLAREPDESDFEDMEGFEEGRRNLQEMLDMIAQERNAKKASELMEQGVDLYQAGNSREALSKFNQAVKLAPEIDMLYFHRARCHVALGSPDAAQADLQRFQESSAHWPKQQRAEIQKAVDALKKEIDKLQKDVHQRGKDVALLLQSAKDALRADKYTEAVRFLREALKKCPLPAQAGLKPEIATELMNCAMQAATPAFDDQCSVPGQLISICEQAVSWLAEAKQLHLTSAEVAKIDKILSNRLEMLRAFGTPKVVKMYQEAVDAYNDGKGEEACQILRDALLASGGKDTFRLGGRKIVGGAQRLRDDLSNILVSLAAPSMHKPRKDPEAIRQAEEAVDLDPSNQDAQKVLLILQSKPR